MTDTNRDERSPLISHYERLSDTIDQRTVFQRKISVWLILLSAGLERLSFYSLAGNLVLFLTSKWIHWTSAHSLTTVFLFLGISYVSALFFAWLSDNKVGRPKTIIFGFILYVIGYVLITLISDNEHHYSKHNLFCRSSNVSSNSFSQHLSGEPCFPSIFSALILVAIGAGAVQANMAVFGAEQVREQKTARQYFDNYYAAVNIGGLTAFAFIAYTQQNESYVIGYTVPAGLLILALLFFVIGCKFYITIEPENSVLSKLIPVFRNAFRTWRKQRRYAQTTSPTNASGMSDPLLSRMNEPLKSFLDYAKVSNQGDFLDRVVDDIKSVRRILAVFLLLIPYWLIYVQIETTFLIQGAHMKILHLFNVKNGQHNMPIIWLSLSDQLIIILVIFILNKFVYKRLEKKGQLFSIRSRIVLGMILAMIAMCMAGTVEIFREGSCDQGNITQIIGQTEYVAAPLWIFYQFPQYIAIGASEVFTAVASLEFAYLAAPQSAHSLIMSLRFCSAGISAFIASIYVTVFDELQENFIFNNDQCKVPGRSHLFYYYFFVLAGLQLIFIVIFLVCEKKFQLLKFSKRKLATRLFVGSNSQATTS